MQKQNFEKQVHDKMEELSFVPTAPVWHKIEEQIKKKRERRRIIFWLLIPVIVTAGGFYWYFSNNDNNNNNTSSDIAVNQNVSNTEKKLHKHIKDDKNGNEPLVEEDRNFDKRKSFDKHISSTISKKDRSLEEVKQQRSSITEKFYRIETEYVATSDKGDDDNIMEDGKQEESPKVQKLIAGNKSDTDTLSNLTAKNKNDSINKLSTLVDTVLKEAIINNKTVTTVDSALVETIVNNKKKNKLHVGINVGVGASGITAGVLGLFNVNRDEALRFNSPIGNNAGSGFQPLPQSTHIRGISFSAGISLKKQITNKASLSSGINYNYFSTRRYVGEKINNDTVIAQSANSVSLETYYRNNSRSNKYQTGFHFIDIPVSVEYQVFKKLPLSLNAGFNLMQMIYTNNLIFSSTSNIYYKDDENMQKMQFHLSGGFNYRLLKQKGNTWFLGPQLQYSLSPLFKNNEDQRLFFLGIKSKFYFN